MAQDKVARRHPGGDENHTVAYCLSVPSALLSIRMSMGKRLKPEEYTQGTWRISELAQDFELLDVWALPASGRLEEFGDLCGIVLDPSPAASTSSSRPQRASAWASDQLFTIRYKLGKIFGWDDDVNTLPIPGCTETSLRERLSVEEAAELDQWDQTPQPEDSTQDQSTTSSLELAFRPILKTETEFAAELSNKTVHAVMHLGWVQLGPDSYEGQLGVYVKHRGRLGRPYMTAIAPFRHYLVYPAMMKRIGRSWQAR